MSPRPGSFALLAGLLIAACSSPTDVDPLTVSLRIVTFATMPERAAWALLPTIEGGATLVVRGSVLTGGCGIPEAHVQRRDNVVGVEIRTVDTGQPCPATIHSFPVEATVSGLAPGVYRVRVGMVGHRQRVDGTATIVAP
jgi:hypothetical protein